VPLERYYKLFFGDILQIYKSVTNITNSRCKALRDAVSLFVCFVELVINL